MPSKELRALVPLREATDCLRCACDGWWMPPGPPTPPPLLRAASMAQDVIRSNQGEDWDDEEEEPQGLIPLVRKFVPQNIMSDVSQ